MLDIINGFLTGVLVPAALILAGVFYSIRLGLFHILRPSAVIGGMRSKRGGGISSAKAVTLALAGTLGVGNIVGVTSAIHLGGAGAVFWMWISALVAMILKYAEIVLAIRYRKNDGRGGFIGGAMYYIRACFEALGLNAAAGLIAAAFAVFFLLTSFTMGSMLQSKAVAEALEGVVGLPPLWTCAVLGTATFFVIRRGTGSISALTDILVPIMSMGYIVLSLAVIFKNRGELSDIFSMIVTSAFSRRSALAGVGGYTFTEAIRYGVMRGLVSNEAGCGTAPAAHALAEKTSPAKQGMWGIFEVFVDTVLLCTMTALSVLCEYDTARVYGGNYMMMTVAAYSASLGHFAAYFLAVAVLCFGFATILCWAHYGTVCARYFGDTHKTRRRFMLIYCLCVVSGAVISSDLVWQLSDLAMGAMTLINLLVLVLMSRQVKDETSLYLNDRKQRRHASRVK